jgi:hypothetical protein
LAGEGIDLTPVDYVSAAVLALARRCESFNRRFHLLNPRPLSRAALAETVRRAGFPVREAAWDEWLATLRSHAERSGNEALSAWLEGAAATGGTGPVLKQGQTQTALADTPVRGPADPAALLEGYLAHLQRLGLLPHAGRLPRIDAVPLQGCGR